MQNCQKIIITGATGGIGSEIVKGLGVPNSQLLLVGTKKEEMKGLVDVVEQNGGAASLLTLDFKNLNITKKLMGEAIADMDEVSWVIHCAGSIEEGYVSGDVQVEGIENVFKVNVISPLIISNLVDEKIKPNGGSIYISSTASTGNGRVPAYASSKAALSTLGKSIALQWKNTGKRAIVIEPGATNTAMREKFAGDSSSHQNPTIIADLIKEIISNKKDYTNGSVWRVTNNKITQQEI